MAFTTLKDWRQRKGTTAQEEADHIRSQMANVPDAVTMSLLPPAISDMGTSSGFTYYLQDRGERLSGTQKAADELIVQANHNPHLADVYIDGLGEGTSLSCMSTGKKRKPWGFV